MYFELKNKKGQRMAYLSDSGSLEALKGLHNKDNQDLDVYIFEKKNDKQPLEICKLSDILGEL